MDRPEVKLLLQYYITIWYRYYCSYLGLQLVHIRKSGASHRPDGLLVCGKFIEFLCYDFSKENWKSLWLRLTVNRNRKDANEIYGECSGLLQRIPRKS